MNPLLPLFLEEVRELIDRASSDLMALERSGAGPAGTEAVDGAFRAFHTLKGAAALFDFKPMTGMLHTAEDVLGAVRDGHLPAGAGLVDALLRCLDDVQSWLPGIEADEALPPEAPEQAARTGALLAGWLGGQTGGQAGGPGGAALGAAPADQALSDPAPMGWTGTLTQDERAAIAARAPAAGERVLAIAYDPDARCFHRGEDPVALFERVPGLAVLRLDGRPAPHALDAVADPFLCWLGLRAVAVCAPEAVEAVFRLSGGSLRIAPLPADFAPAQASGQADPVLRALLAEQAALLGADRPAVRAAAAGVAAHACRRAGLHELAGRLELAGGLEREGQSGAADTASLAAVADALRLAVAPRQASPVLPPQDASPTATRFLRIAPGRVERLVALAGEAVITKNALAHALGGIERDPAGAHLVQAVKAPMAALDRLVRDWHEAAVQLRMVPVGEVFMRFPRLVRDLARSLDRDVTLRLSGETLEADRDVLESLFEPLVHLVRNSLDHGIESREARRAAGKPATAALILRARAEAEALVIEVEDDGRGLDNAALRSRAVSRGLLAEAEAAGLSEDESSELIFLPGLSTASGVSALSGRGVGMDAVRSAVGRAGGRITLQNRRGEGLKVTLSLPMQMSVTRITTVFAGGTRFGVPLDRVGRIVRVPGARIRTLPALGGEPQRAFAYGAGVCPLIGLAHRLGLPATPSGETLLVLVVDTDDGPAGLEVDRLGERADVILRPLAGLLAGTSAYLGTTLLGDGSVLLVLDVQALLR